MDEKKESENIAIKKSYSWHLFDLSMVIIENLLAIRVVLKFLGVSPLNPLVGSFYLLTDVFAQPGLKVFPNLTLNSEQSIFEGSTILLFFLIYFLHQLAQRRKNYKKEVVSGA